MKKRYILLIFIFILNGCSYTQEEVGRTSEAVVIWSSIGAALSVALKINPIYGVLVGAGVGYVDARKANKEIKHAKQKLDFLHTKIKVLEEENEELEKNIEKGKEALQKLQSSIERLEQLSYSNRTECKKFYNDLILKIRKIDKQISLLKRKKYNLVKSINYLESTDYTYEDKKRLKAMYKLKSKYEEAINYLNETRDKTIEIKYKMEECM